MSLVPRTPFCACYAERYYAETRSRSMVKLRHVAEAVETQGLATLLDPGVVDTERLTQLHHPDYVHAFMNGIRPLAVSQNFGWSEELRQAVLAMQAGQLVGARRALTEGVAANIANGFHHARYGRGGGFCTFNGLALIAQEYPDQRIFVLDCDEHGGNGTEEFTAWLPNLYNFTIHGTRFGCQGGERSQVYHLEPLSGDFAPYQQALERSFEAVLDWKTDLLLYQAGVDCHLNDPMGSIAATTDDLYERDLLVFQFALRHRIPVLFVLAGGYQEMDQLVQLHVNTFVAAHEAKNEL